MLSVNDYKSLSSLKICGHESTKSYEEKTLRLRGLKIKNVEKGFLNLDKTDPFFVILKKLTRNIIDLRNGQKQEQEHWQAVYQSEVISKHLNPLWERSVPINLEQLCDGDTDKHLQIEIWDYEDNGKNRLVAKLESTKTWTELQDMGEGLRGNADRTKELKLVEVKSKKEKSKKTNGDENEVTADKKKEAAGAGVLIVLKDTK